MFRLSIMNTRRIKKYFVVFCFHFHGNINHLYQSSTWINACSSTSACFLILTPHRPPQTERWQILRAMKEHPRISHLCPRSSFPLLSESRSICRWAENLNPPGRPAISAFCLPELCYSAVCHPDCWRWGLLQTIRRSFIYQYLCCVNNKKLEQIHWRRIS